MKFNIAAGISSSEGVCGMHNLQPGINGDSVWLYKATRDAEILMGLQSGQGLVSNRQSAGTKLED